MKRAIIALVGSALLGTTGRSAADELVLKDGKSVAWKCIRDQGDHYEIETPTGTKVTVQKSDVQSLRVSPATEPLTGATFTFDKKRRLDTTDLLSRIEPKRDSIAGAWAVRSGALVGTADGAKHSRIEIPTIPPEEYDLTVVAERKEGDDEFFLGLVGGGAQFVVRFDWARGSSSGLSSPGGVDPSRVTIQGRAFENRKPRTIVCMVRKDGVVVRLDGKDFAVCRTTWAGTSHEAMYAVKRQNVLFLGMAGAGCTWHVSKISLSAPKE